MAKYGLVEMLVDLTGLSGGRFATVQRGILRDEDRLERVIEAAARAVEAKCDTIVFPGWTIVARRPPEKLRRLSVGRTIMLECLDRSSAGARELKEGTLEGQTFVLRHGECSRGLFQWLSRAEQFNRPGEKQAGYLENLCRGILGGERVLKSRRPKSLLLLCGEANLVAGGGAVPCSHRRSLDAHGITEDVLRSFEVILNPSHVAGGPEAIRSKRAWLSQPGLLAFTSNGYTGDWSEVREDGRRRGRSFVNGLSKLWRAGEHASDELVDLPGSDLATDHYRVVTFEG